MDLILASGSRWRKQLLESAGIRCDAIAPNVDEHEIVGDDPVDTARARALAKARDVAQNAPLGSLVLGADQVVHLDGTPLGKPGDGGAHLAMLRLLRGRTHDLVTAVAMVRGGPEVAVVRCFHERTKLCMRGDLSDDELQAYVASGEARGCGGGYMIEARGQQLFEEVRGDWTNVVGLPLFRLVTELRTLGWRPDFA